MCVGGKVSSPPTKRSLEMAEFVLVETYVEHSYHDNYLMGVYYIKLIMMNAMKWYSKILKKTNSFMSIIQKMKKVSL